MKLVSLVSKGNRIAKVRTYGAAGFMIELTELKSSGGEVSKRNYTRLYNKFGTSIREAENWVENNDDSIVTGRLPKLLGLPISQFVEQPGCFVAKKSPQTGQN